MDYNIYPYMPIHTETNELVGSSIGCVTATLAACAGTLTV